MAKREGWWCECAGWWMRGNRDATRASILPPHDASVIQADNGRWYAEVLVSRKDNKWRDLPMDYRTLREAQLACEKALGVEHE